MKTIGDFDNEFQADVVAGLLEGEGIPAVIFNRSSYRATFMVSTLPGTRPYIMVPDEQYERAIEVLGDWHY